jgi:hypothetical protein
MTFAKIMFEIDFFIISQCFAQSWGECLLLSIDRNTRLNGPNYFLERKRMSWPSVKTVFSPKNGFDAGLPDQTKIPIWENILGPWNRKVWYILGPFGIHYCYFLHVMAIR